MNYKSRFKNQNKKLNQLKMSLHFKDFNLKKESKNYKENSFFIKMEMLN